MKIIIFRFILLSSFVLAEQSHSQIPNCSEDAGFKDKQALVKFTENLKTADSAETLSPLISYPLKVNSGSKKHFLIKNESELKIRFKEVFSEKILKALHTQDPNITFCNYQGLTIGGNVWINKKNGKTGIYVVNLPSR